MRDHDEAWSPRAAGRGVYARRLKRVLDVAGAGVLIVLAWPLMTMIAAAIWATLGRPVIYGQVRPGLHEQPFRIWKFRTMTDARDDEGRLLSDGERLTPIGRWLRERSLDELPQVLNVLVGHMSLIGPRPLLVRYLDRYTARQRLRHGVKPGITGWAQVNGRNAADWETRLELDAWYAEHVSFVLDLRILARTCRRVIDRRDVLAAGGAELDEFWGGQGVPPDGPRAYPVEADERV